MTDAPNTPVDNIVGIVTPVEDEAPLNAEERLKKRVEAALVSPKTWAFRGVVFRLSPILPAAMLMSIGKVQTGADVSQFINALTDLFHPEDAKKFVDMINDTNHEFPIDMEFLSEAFAEISKEINGRDLPSAGS